MYDEAVDALNSYFMPQMKAAFARQSLHEINPKAGETTQQFATRLKKAAVNCHYGAEADNNVRDAILWKYPCSYLKRKLMEEGEGLTKARTRTLAAQCEKM